MPFIKRINSSDTTVVALSHEIMVVGRSESCDVRVSVEHEVSREHCGFRVYSDGTVTVADLGSKNGTCVNGERIHQETNLKDGDVIRLTRKVEFKYLVHDPSGGLDETLMVVPDDATIQEEVERLRKAPPKSPTIDLSEAVNEVEKELENAGFKTLMAKFARQAKPRPKRPKPEGEGGDNEEYW